MNINRRKWILTLGSLLLIPLPLVILAYTSLIPFYNFLPIALGITAYCWLLTTFYLATKPRWIDRWIGLPEIYAIHGMLPVFACIFFVLHTQFFDIPLSLKKISGGVGSYIIIGVTILSLLYFTVIKLPENKWIAKFQEFLTQKVNHEQFVMLHRLNFVGILLIYLHIFLLKEIIKNPLFFIILTLYTLIALASFFKMHTDQEKLAHKGELTDIDKLDQDIIQLTIKAEPTYLETIKPGQFVFIRFDGKKDLGDYHPFSITQKGSDKFSLVISKIGDFTKALDQVNPGAQVSLSKPFGILDDIFQHTAKDKPLLIVAGGIGITPMLSLIDKYEDRDIHLFYSVRKDRELLFQDKLNQWTSRPNIHLHTVKGFFKADEIIHSVPNFQAAQTILAGPPKLIENFHTEFAKAGLTEDQIFFEEFGW